MLYIILCTYASIVFFLCVLIGLFDKERSKNRPINNILFVIIPFTVGFLQCIVPLLTHLGVIK